MIRIRDRVFLDLPDPDLLVRGTDPDPDPSLRKILANNKIFKTEDNVPAGTVSYKKKYENKFFFFHP